MDETLVDRIEKHLSDTPVDEPVSTPAPTPEELAAAEATSVRRSSVRMDPIDW